MSFLPYNRERRWHGPLDRASATVMEFIFLRDPNLVSQEEIERFVERSFPGMYDQRYVEEMLFDLYSNDWVVQR